ncbi:unnamed protein product [Diatraea saccharalis]|uniref:GPI inositol-deacylase n=1 Tax=Diatraea saccharalis TaxID=40085 RepID=A0A9N9QYH8_9NEOP|nr:unnamed protein product [Diatraea saccharalis]
MKLIIIFLAQRYNDIITMKFLTRIGSSVFQGLSILFVLGYLLGILNLHFSDKNDYCIMTYMFEYPQFVRISVSENVVYPQYGLFAYSEGRYTERARKMWFDGVPVLYLPGNSGSHMQARSLASVALRKALNKNYEYHFDFFTISYNEELSGLYGGVLQSQTKFAAACISKILSLYKSNKYTKSVPTSVILIGHSMGGVIAKRLMAYPSTLDKTNIAIALAAPLQAPALNTDLAMNDYYKLMEFEWDLYINNDPLTKDRKMMISFGNGPRDVLMPAALTFSKDSYINALTTAVPGVWVSADHVSIVWCKQLVMAINRFLFAIVDPKTDQISEDQLIWKSKARQFFQANRSMFLNPNIPHRNVTMLADAFWYEDSRRIYQISRPEINRMTYLMIRLANFPQNRFVAIEAVNVEDKEWIFGCNAVHVYGSHRYCKYATALSELSRWSSAATNFGKRKLATIHLHDIQELHPDWSHVIVKVSPTRKPIILNVDVNDHASRQIYVDLPSDLSFGKTIIKHETEPNSLYYELLLPGFTAVHQSYLLYVEPTGGCKATQYHVSAELHVPWAKNYEYSHFFTHSKVSPMKLRLYMSNPNVTSGGEDQPVKVTLLLDPQCSFTISISPSWYLRLAQLARNYTTVLIPYVAAIVLLAARSSILYLREHGKCLSIHSALMSEGVKPYYALVFSRLGTMVFMSMPVLSFLFENASWNNLELRYFTQSLLVLPMYMTALGILNVGVAALLAVMVFSSQLAHRLLFRIVWRGGPALAEKVASGLQKVPMVVSAALVCAVPLSCGAASLAAGAAFYAFMISKMYEEYLEDYVYKLMAKIASKVCRMFKSNKDLNNESQISVNSNEVQSNIDVVTSEKNNDKKDEAKENADNTGGNNEDGKEIADNNEVVVAQSDEKADEKEEKNCNEKSRRKGSGDSSTDDDLNNLNFHVMMFLLWICVTLVNLPALLTWARNFTFSMVLKPDTSYHTGMIMSACSACIWQMEGPRKKLRFYEPVAALIFTMSVFILALGPLSLTIVNYGITFMFAVITIQQLCDKEDIIASEDMKTTKDSQDDDEGANNSNKENKNSENENNKAEGNSDEKEAKEHDNASGKTETEKTDDDCDVCSESRIYGVFKRLRDKFSFTEDE